MMVDLLTNLFAFYMTFGHQPYDKQMASDSARRCCLIFKSLSDQAKDLKLWKMKPKMHLFIELADYAVFEHGDPSKFWTYMDEDFMGTISKFAATRGGKRSPATIPHNVLAKYRSTVTI